VPPQPLTPSAAYESNWTLPRYLKPKVGAYGMTYGVRRIIVNDFLRKNKCLSFVAEL